MESLKILYLLNWEVFFMKVFIPANPNDFSNYKNALSKHNISFIISENIYDITLCNALLLPGGGDIAPFFFGEKNKGSYNISLGSDILCFSAIDYAYKKSLPVLGICKGMQIINVYFGGKINQHLKNADLHSFNKKDSMHETIILPNNILNDIYGSCLCVNSAHHQGISLTGQNLYPVQYASDGTIEGIIHACKPIIGVQWHPERIECGKYLFDFFAKCH